MQENYLEAQKRSYGWRPDFIRIPAADRENIVHIAMEINSDGLAARGDTLIGAGYWQPAMFEAKFQTTDDYDLEIKVKWIRGVRNRRGESVRLFPSLLKASEANRCQTVNFASGGGYWISRNSDHVFYRIYPKDGVWKLSRQKIVLSPNREIHSALFTGEELLTVESDEAAKWWFCGYEIKDNMATENFRYEWEPYLYGLCEGLREEEDFDEMWYITDYRCSLPHGIYRGRELVLPGICGSGLAKVKSTGHLVVAGTPFPEDSPFGVPCALTIIPPACLSGRAKKVKRILYIYGQRVVLR